MRLAAEPTDPERLAYVRVLRLLLAYLGGMGAGRPRSAGEIYAYASLSRTGKSSAEVTAYLETLVDGGLLVARDGVVSLAYNQHGRRPFRGYFLPTGDTPETGGAL